MVLLGILGIVWLILMALCIHMMRRNEKVKEYHLNLLAKIHELNQRDILLGKDWQWRFDEYSKVSYNTMMLKFWKPLESFYPDKSFLKE